MKIAKTISAAAALLLLAGCTVPRPDADATPARFPTTPEPEAALVCGVEQAAVELLTGNPTSRSNDEIVVADGVGSGECEVFSDARRGEQFVVTLHPATSPEAAQMRERLQGTLGRPPSVVYDAGSADGGTWGTGATPSTGDGVSAGSSIFWGDTLIEVFISPAAATGRDLSADLLALTSQVAASYGLERPDPSS